MKIFSILFLVGLVIVAILFSIKVAAIIFLVAIGIIVCLAALLLFAAFGGNNTKYLKKKFGDNYQDLIVAGKLGESIAAPCRPDWHYTKHDALCKEINIDLPEYDIVSCKGTLPNFNGDYHETAEIRFRTPITFDIKKKLLSLNKSSNYNHSNSLFCNIKTPFQEPNSIDDTFWSLQIIDDFNGIIDYGRV